MTAPRLVGVTQIASDGAVVLAVQESVYGLEVLFKTCYLFTDRCYLFLRRTRDRAIEVHIATKNQTVDPDVLVGEFCNELIDQRLRTDISQESGKLRELIVAQAFAEGNLLGEADGTAQHDDYNEDPLNIGDFHEHKKG